MTPQPLLGEAFRCYTCEQPTAINSCKNIAQCKMEDTACKTVLETVEAGKAGFRQGLGVHLVSGLPHPSIFPFIHYCFAQPRRQRGRNGVCACMCGSAYGITPYRWCSQLDV